MMTDAQIEQNISNLKTAIRSWAEANQVWQDAGFTTFDKHFNDEPWDWPCVLVIYYEGPLFDILNGYADDDRLLSEFLELFDGTDFYLEHYDHVTSVVIPRNAEIAQPYKKYFDFKWLCKLVAPDFAGIYQEIFAHFANYPEHLRSLDPLDFEKLLGSIFGNHGYRTELGPGWGDGGVDLRLYQKDSIGEVVTLVQAKRYAEKYPIRLEAVAALKAMVDDEGANRGLFVTTSRFLPGTEDFAAKHSKVLKLATSDDIVRWCNEVNRRMSNYSPVPDGEIALRIYREGRALDSLLGRIVHTSWGYDMTINEFYLVIKETSKAALLMQLPKESDLSGHLTGHEKPAIDPDFQPPANEGNSYIRARKLGDSDDIRLRGDLKTFRIWDGEPRYFNYLD